MGREAAAALLPSADPETVRARLAETSQMKALLTLGGQHAAVPLGVPDVREPLQRCAAGGILSAQELAEVADAVEGVARLRAYLASEAVADGPAPLLGRWVGHLVDATPVAQAIWRAVSADGQVLDSASAELAAIRLRLRRSAERAYEALERLVRSPHVRKALQEPIITRRAGRYVVPVRQEYRELVPGIVHGTSASGATLFVEPMSVVEANNAVRTEQAREQEEVERILRELSTRVAGVAAKLLDALEAVGEIDAIAARARLSLDMQGVEPAINTEGRVVLHEARHPLLKGEVVPIGVEVGRSFSVLVITGPNTGGKTVALKTVGLLTLMAQAGLHVPAGAGSEVAVFQRIRADIGDQQSVTDNLSTFSSHLRRIIPILAEADPDMLVLLDELGAGTDPEEGAALGCAILERLRAAGARVIVTTHLGDIKLMAHMTPGMANASVSFDLETLAPTYRLQIGAPGQSQALAIAARLGLPPEVVGDARRRLGPERIRADALIEQLQAALDAARQRQAEASAARSEAVAALKRAREELEKIRARRREILDEALARAEELARQARREFEALIRQGREAAKVQQLDEVRRLRQELAEARRRLEARAVALSERLNEVEDRVSVELAPGQILEPLQDLCQVEAGQRVCVLPLRSTGLVVEAADEQGYVVVQVGSARTRVRADQLAWIPQQESRGQVPTGGAASSLTLGAVKAASLPGEIDLRGLTADEATGRLDKYLDDCTLAGVERVRVIHGRGTGALREAVRSYLRENRRVRRFAAAGPAEGGDGVTVVELA